MYRCEGIACKVPLWSFICFEKIVENKIIVILRAATLTMVDVVWVRFIVNFAMRVEGKVMLPS